jgi:hypothetical protein
LYSPSAMNGQSSHPLAGERGTVIEYGHEG